MLPQIFASAQKLIKDYVVKNQFPVRVIEPDSTNYSDLEAIGNAIGDAKVVMLGEQDHGDAPTFLAKTRLVKYLHEKKGFNVLAFESDFFALNEGWDKLNKAHPVMDTFLKKNIFPVWTVCNTCSALFYNYIPYTYTTSNPLVISGFDSQQYLYYSHKHLIPGLDSVLRHVNAPIVNQSNYTSAIIQLVDSSVQWPLLPPNDTVKVNKCLGYLAAIQKQLTAALDKDSFWLFVVDNIVQQVRGVKNSLLTGKPVIAINERDIQMAKNLKWLDEIKFKNEKIIVWAADAHVAKSLKNMKDTFFYSQATMGDKFTSQLSAGEKVYVLVFSSFSGTAGRLGTKPYKLYYARNSFETWIDGKYPYAFVDFSAFNQTYPNATEFFYMTALDHHAYEGKWNNVFDGIFFIKDMYPCLPYQYQ